MCFLPSAGVPQDCGGTAGWLYIPFPSPIPPFSSAFKTQYILFCAPHFCTFPIRKIFYKHYIESGETVKQPGRKMTSYALARLARAIRETAFTARSKESVVAVPLPTLSNAVPWAQVAMG